MNVTKGRCLCKAVTYQVRGEPKWRAHCHCESCRRNVSSAFTTFFGVDYDKFEWTGVKPKTYVSSPGVRRSFCGTCGSPMAFESERWPGEIHLYAASLEDSSKFTAQGHVHFAEAVPWVELGDKLPRYPHAGS
jgi:hypothetical protein